MTEDWELSHLPLDDPRAVHPPEELHVVVCKSCGRQDLNPDLVFRKDVIVGGRWVTYYFCSERTYHEWYIKQLQTLGM